MQWTQPLSISVLNLLPKLTNLPSLVAMRLVKVGINFLNCHVTSYWSPDQRVMWF